MALSAMVVLSPAFAMAETTIKLCTGGDGGAYHFAGQSIAEKAKGIAVELVIDTGGTMANIDLTINGDCDAFIGQPDGLPKLKRTDKNAAFKLRRIAKLHKEYAHFLCSKESGVTAIGDIYDDAQYSIDLVSDGSATIKKVHSGSAYMAASSVASGEVTCALFVAAAGDGTISSIDVDIGADLVLAKAVDKDFNDAVDLKGNSLYEFDDIPKTYEVNLQTGWFSSVKTVSMRAGVYINKDKISGKDLERFVKAVNKAAGVVRDEFDK